MEKKKICWITSNEYIDVDLPIMSTLSRHYDVDWHIIHNKRAKIDYTEIVKKQTQVTTIRCKFHYLENRRRNPKIIKEYWKILKEINKKKYGLFYFDIDGLPFFFPLVLLMFNRHKVVCAAHNVTTPKGAINYNYAKLYMGFILRFFNNFHVFSRNQYAVIQNKHPGKNVFFAPLALIDFGKIGAALPKDQVIFLFFGYIRDYKRVDILINAANKVYENTNKKFKVRIFGSCSNWEKYERLIKYPEIFELRIKSIPNEEIPPLFEESHYFVMPYQDLAQSGALTVAFNYHLPVIGSDIDSLREFIIDGENGFLFKKGSVDSLVAVMMRLLDMDEKSYLQIRENLTKYVEKNYSTESVVKLYVEFFESMNK